MGPSRLFHKDRSQQSLLNTQDANDKRPYHSSPRDSPLPSPAFPPLTGPPPFDDDDVVVDQEDQPHTAPYHPDDVQYYHSSSRGHQPTRSLSHRGPAPINTNQPTIHLVRPAQGTASTPASAIETDEPDRYYYQRPEPALPPPKEDRRQKRRFFGLGGSKEPSAPTNKLGRSRSIRGKDQQVEQVPEPQKPTPHQQSQHQFHLHHHPRQQQQQQHLLQEQDHQSRPQPQHQHHHWGSSHVSPTEDGEEGEDEEEDEGGTGLHPTHSHGGLDKDPLRSPGFPPPVSHQDYPYGKSGQQPVNQNPSTRQPVDRQGSYQSSWDRAAYQVQHHSHSDLAQSQTTTTAATPLSYNPSPSSATSAPSLSIQPRSQPETVQQQLWQDPDSRPSSRQSLEPSLSTSAHPYGHHARASSSQASSISHVPGSMGPPPNQPQPPSRRSSEAQQSQQSVQSREAVSYQPYSQAAVLSSNAPSQYASQLAPQGQYRGTQPSPMQGSEQGRSTPPPSRSRDDLSNLDFGQLLARHEEFQEKYRKVKKYYFDYLNQVQQLSSQVLQLQNALAHQRLSQSRTSLDDNEYANRFSRLDGAINNLAFNIRREWRTIPAWLAPHVNRDATTQQTKEMTAVGRAAISRWLVEEILDRYFHPAIEPGFSSQLKLVEKNLRRFSAPASNDEEKDAMLSKISNWRLSTLDGLQEALASPQAAEYRASLTASLIEKLTASLSMSLKDPPPPGLDGGVTMIVELAVGIAANLPLESRDVYVEYITPGQLVNEAYMKIESGLPALTNPGDGPIDPIDSSSLMRHMQNEDTGSIDSRDTSTSNGNGSDDIPISSQPTLQNQQSPPPQSGQQQQSAGQKQDPQQQQQTTKKKGMFGSLMGGNSGGSAITAGSKKGPLGHAGVQQQQLSQSQQQQQMLQASVSGGQSGPQEKKDERVRFSTFLAVEMRGRNVLIKAPVYLRE